MVLTRIQTYFLDHLSGAQAWGLVLAVNLVGLRLALTPVEGEWLGLWVIGLAGIWQVMGGVRTLRAELGRSGGIIPAILLLLAMLWLVASFLITVADFRASQVEVSPPVFETHKLEMQDEGRVVLISGPLDFARNTALKELVAEKAGIERVLLDSDGGSVIAGRALAHTIAQNGLSTRVEGRCYSACTLAFIAGVSRQLGPEGQLGFHAYRYENQFQLATLDPEAEQQKDRAFFRAQGLSPAFVSRVFDAPADEIWVPTRAELIQAGILTD